ncbi:hypothetical protein [Paenibacillus campi]|uniref:hypothetical protein n=1 Tax=Paenibacillus campi TaxID=3106031 RepID=UPI002AFE8098|nr:hypothetical protein [Paenibacillus sp. SGZ-1014]
MQWRLIRTSSAKQMIAYSLYVGLVVLGLLVPFPGIATIRTIEDLIYTRLYGYNDHGANIVALFYFWVVFFGYIYVQMVKLDREWSVDVYYCLIRYGRSLAWFLHDMKHAGMRAAVFLSGLIVVCMLIGVCRGLSWTPSGYTELTITQLLYHVLINGWLQIMNYELFLLILHWLSPRADVRFAGLIWLLILSTPLFAHMYVPSGLNALGQIAHGWADMLPITGLLVVWMIVQCIVASIVFQKLPPAT